MKYFAIVVLSSISNAQLLENQNVFAEKVILPHPTEADKSLGTLLQVATGWSKNQAGEDATLDLKLWLNFEKVSS